MFIAGLDGAAGDLGFGDAASQARRKLLSSLAPLGDVDRLANRFHLDSTAWYGHDDRPPYLAVVTEALWNDRLLQLRYASWRRESDRTVEPLGVVLKAGRWYLVARAAAEEHQEVRMFRCSEIRAAAIGKKFRRPSTFDLAAWWAQRASAFEAGVFERTATVRVSVKGLQQMREFGMVTEVEPFTGPGWKTVDVPIESDARAAAAFGRLGAEAEVIFPRSLRRAMRRMATDVAKLYASR